MEFYKEILIKVLEKEEVHIIFPNITVNANEIIKLECYNALQKIKTIIEDDSLEDAKCFMKIEEIVCLFESLGSNGGNRHDFG